MKHVTDHFIIVKNNHNTIETMNNILQMNYMSQMKHLTDHFDIIKNNHTTIEKMILKIRG